MTPAGGMQATRLGTAAGINASVPPDKEQFDGDDTSDAVERREPVGIRGSLAGLRWQGRVLQGRDMLPPLDRHYLRHVILQRE